MEEQRPLTLLDLEKLILQLGYPKSTAAVILAFLRSRDEKQQTQAEIESILPQLQDFLSRCLKPRYLAQSINRLFALVDITVEARADAVYFIRHLFDPQQENARLPLEYLRMQYLGADAYNLAALEGMDYVVIYARLSLKEALEAIETDPRLAP